MSPSNKEPILIIGGGLIGLAIAYELARQGRAVEILSRRRSEAAGFVAAKSGALLLRALRRLLLVRLHATGLS